MSEWEGGAPPRSQTPPSAEPVPPRLMLPLPLARPVFVYALLTIILIVYVAMTLAGGSERVSVLVQFGAKVNARIAGGEYWRLLTATFLHIGLVHLAFNGWALYAIGGDTERLLGNARFLVIYLFSAVAATLVSFVSTPAISAGASGAIFGTLGALGVYFLVHRRAFGRAGRGRLVNIVVVALLNIVYGSVTPGIDNAAHMGGLVAGAALAVFLCPRYKVEFGPPQMRLVDVNPLSRRWYVVVLAVALLALAILWGVRSQGGARFAGSAGPREVLNDLERQVGSSSRVRGGVVSGHGATTRPSG